jgi:probable rRNA maturation factor
MPKKFLHIRVFNRQRKHRLDLPHLQAVASRTLSALGLERKEVSIVFISDPKMRQLNQRYRGKSGSTDVLSFGETGIVDYLGDVFISAETAYVNAMRIGHTLQHESSILVLHGLLHLAGYDHEVDQGQMRALERKLRRSCMSQA